MGYAFVSFAFLFYGKIGAVGSLRSRLVS